MSQPHKFRVEGGRFIKTRDFTSSTRQRWRLFSRWRPSKARREHACMETLRALGVPCPGDPRVHEVRNALGLLVRAELSMDYLATAVDLRFLALKPEYADRRADSPWRLAVITQVAKWVRHLHQHDYFALNLHFRNFLVDLSEPRPSKVYLIDCVSGRFCRLPWRRDYLLMRDLALLFRDGRQHCTRREQLVFLRHYFDRPRLTAADRRLLTRIDRCITRKWGTRSSSLDD